MLESSVIQPSNSLYASPVVLVKKKTAGIGCAFDYNKLNKINVFDPDLMSTCANVFEKLFNDRYLTTIDQAKSYRQIPVAKDDEPKTALVTYKGSYELLRMPFGMINSSATFVRAMKNYCNSLAM